MRRALANLDAIAEYISRDNPEAARFVVRQIREMTEQLAKFPFLGRASERVDVRKFVVHAHYLVSYRVRPDRIEILQEWHKRRIDGGTSDMLYEAALHLSAVDEQLRSENVRFVEVAL